MHAVNEKIEILEIPQERQVHADGQHQGALSLLRPFRVGNPLRTNKVHDSR